MVQPLGQALCVPSSKGSISVRVCKDHGKQNTLNTLLVGLSKRWLWRLLVRSKSLKASNISCNIVDFVSVGSKCAPSPFVPQLLSHKPCCLHEVAIVVLHRIMRFIECIMISGRDGTQLLEDVEKRKTAAVWPRLRVRGCWGPVPVAGPRSTSTCCDRRRRRRLTSSS